MITTISDNNARKICEDLSAIRPELGVVADYGHNVLKFIDFLSTCDGHPKRLFFFCESVPTLPTSINAVLNRACWSFRDMTYFLLSPPHVSFKGHVAVYEEDVSRLCRWRIQYAAGPFARLCNKTQHKAMYKAVQLALTSLLLICGLLIQIAVPSFRPHKGSLVFNYKHIDVTVYFDGNPEKDHYGESPLVEKKINQFAEVLRNHHNAAVFVAAGPRHLYLKRIFQLKGAQFLENVIIYCSGLFRPAAYKVVADCKDGQFFKGSNISIDHKMIYSNHCLSIGAGEKELWRYRKAR